MWVSGCRSIASNFLKPTGMHMFGPLVDKVGGHDDVIGSGTTRPGVDVFPFQDGKLLNPYQFLLRWTGLPILDGVTVNEMKSSDYSGFQRNDHPVIESMEGAALHYVCLMENVPFIQIRAVSNELGERDKSRWKLKESMAALHGSLVSMIQKFETADETLFRI